MFTCLIFTTWPVHILYSLTIEKFCAFNFRHLSNWQKIVNRENFRPTVFIVHSYEYTTLLLKASGWSLPSPPPSLLLSPFPSLPPPSLLPLPYHPHNPLPISSPSPPHPLPIPSPFPPHPLPGCCSACGWWSDVGGRERFDPEWGAKGEGKPGKGPLPWCRYLPPGWPPQRSGRRSCQTPLWQVASYFFNVALNSQAFTTSDCWPLAVC